MDKNGVTSTKPHTVYVLIKPTSAYGLGGTMLPSLGQQSMQPQQQQQQQERGQRMLQNPYLQSPRTQSQRLP